MALHPSPYGKKSGKKRGKSPAARSRTRKPMGAGRGYKGRSGKK